MPNAGPCTTILQSKRCELALGKRISYSTCIAAAGAGAEAGAGAGAAKENLEIAEKIIGSAHV